MSWLPACMPKLIVLHVIPNFKDEECGTENCGVFYFGGNILRNGTQATSFTIAHRQEIEFGKSNGTSTICGRRWLPEVPKIAFGTRLFRLSLSRPTARMSRYLSIW